MNVSRSTHTADASGERIDHEAMMIGEVSISRKRILGSLFKLSACCELRAYASTGKLVRYMHGSDIVWVRR